MDETEQFLGLILRHINGKAQSRARMKASPLGQERLVADENVGHVHDCDGRSVGTMKSRQRALTGDHGSYSLLLTMAARAWDSSSSMNGSNVFPNLHAVRKP